MTYHRTRLHKPEQIMSGFKAGTLLCRGVRLESDSYGNYGGEIEYQQNRVKPRPGTILKEGMRIKPFGEFLYLGLEPFKVLYCYKKDVFTTNSGQLAEPRYLQPTSDCLLKKITELDNRIDSLYPPKTSGSLTIDGTYKSGHDKFKSTENYLKCNEVVIEGYRTEQYSCVFIPTPFKISHLYEALKDKARLENELSIEEMPLAFYEYECGNIKDIVYLSDLGIFPSQLPAMAANIDKIKHLAILSSSQIFDDLVSMLSPLRSLKFLTDLPYSVDESIKKLSTPYRHALLHGVEKGNLHKVTLCHQNGANLAACYFHNEYQKNLLEIFLEAKCIKNWACDSSYELLAEQTALGKLLYDQGCRIVVDSNLFKKLPLLAFYMLDKGEPLQKDDIDSCLFVSLISCLNKGFITENEIVISIKLIKQQYACEAEHLDCAFTDSLMREIFIINTMPSNIHPYQEQFIYNAGLFSYLGIFADISAIRKKLEKIFHKKLDELLCDLNWEKQHAIRKIICALDPNERLNWYKKNFPEKFLTINNTQETIERLISYLEGIQNSESVLQVRAQFLNLVPTENNNPAPTEKKIISAFEWIRDLYQYNPETAGKTYPELAQLAIRHYYQTPHPDQAMKLLANNKKVPVLLRKDHGVDHVTRTQILSEALLELFAKHDPQYKELLDNEPDLHELIPLALVYHDVVAEVEPKNVEELRASECFERDMKGSNRYPETLISLVSNALRNKNTNTMNPVLPPFLADTKCPPKERMVRHLLRLPDNIDIIRVLAIPEGWKNPSHTSSPTHVFDAGLMDIPANLIANPNFKKDFDDLMEGAKGLAYVTGGAPAAGDCSISGSYLRRHNLQADNDKRKLKVARSVNAHDCVMAALDDNVRRSIAGLAGLTTCQADHSKEAIRKGSGRATCVAEDQGREFLTAIHSELELRQVQLPKMTVLEKLLFEQQGQTCLAPGTRALIDLEVVRLKKQGIQPPTGTLTQKTLKSPRAVKKLHSDYELETTKSKRFCGYNDDGSRRYTTILTPEPAIADQAMETDTPET